EAGANVVALDATNRIRPGNEKLDDIIKNLKRNYPNIIVMGDIATYEDGVRAEELGCDMIATTLSGYTNKTCNTTGVDYSLINTLSKKVNIPVIAEGRIGSPDEAKKTIDNGAHAAVVGTMITRPEKITEEFVANLKKGMVE